MAANVNIATVVVSIVSHGHGAMVQRLLWALAECSADCLRRVVLTHNIPEPAPQAPEGGWPFALELRSNLQPLGFSANHNRALEGAQEPFFCLLNPDVQGLDQGVFLALLQSLQSDAVGLAFPQQIDAAGRVQDSRREVPTPWRLFLRYGFKRHEMRTEWVNAACWLVRATAWRQVQGLDEGYFMYCEDVDFCLRLRLAGWQLAAAQTAVEHAGQRASHRDWQHTLWHVGALLRLWCSPVFWRSRKLLRRLRADPGDGFY